MAKKKHPGLAKFLNTIKTQVLPKVLKVVDEGIHAVATAVNSAVPGAGAFVDALGDSLTKAGEKALSAGITAVADGKKVLKTVGADIKKEAGVISTDVKKEVKKISTKVTKGGLSYICTATADFYKLDHDSEDFKTLRDFRDSALIKDAEGKRLLVRYNSAGPRLVDLLNKADDKAILFADCMSYISKTASLIRQKKYSEAILLYIDLCFNLSEHFQITI